MLCPPPSGSSGGGQCPPREAQGGHCPICPPVCPPLNVFMLKFYLINLNIFFYGTAPFFFRIMGYKSCSVLSCKNNTRKKHDISFHITENPELQNKWLSANTIGWKNKKNFCVCSEHFLESDFKYDYLNKRCLKKTAVPSIFHR